MTVPPPLDPLRPWNGLPHLPPTADLETRPVLRACIEARAAVAELKQAGHAVPNQAILINTIPLLEAQASSEIENIVTTGDRLFRFDRSPDLDTADPATKEALRYRTALSRGFHSIQVRPLSTATAVEVCRTILGIDLDVRRVPGTALVNARTGQVIYSPPEGEALLRELLANWERFLHDTRDLDPLIRMAVGHYQFEAIHPFSDGNGRTGRVLNLLFLVQAGLLELPVLYLSGAIIRRKDDYYRLLAEVTTLGAWEPWIVYMLDAVAETARWTTDRIIGIRDLMRSMGRDIRTELPAVYSRELLELVFVQPYCRIQNVVDAGIAKRQTAATYLRRLADAGFLREIRSGRDKLFLNIRLVDLLMDSQALQRREPVTS